MSTQEDTEVLELNSMVATLPPAALAHVLQRVDVRQRLDACARVCKAWKAAAVAATRKVELLGCTQHKCTALEPWLRTKAASLQPLDSITISARFDSRILAADAWVNTPNSTWRMPELLLPYQQLPGLTKLVLKLIKCPLAAAAAASHQLPRPGSISTSTSTGDKAPATFLAALTALKELSMTDCVILLDGLPALTGLESLQLSQGWGAPLGASTPRGTPAAAAPAPAAASVISGSTAGAALPSLARLTHLALAGSCCTPEAFLHLHCLEHLQELILGWAELPQPVVAGCEAWASGITLDTSSMPGLSKLTALQKLVVAGAVEAVDPVLLQGLPASLRHLQLDDVRLVMTLGQSRMAMLAGLKQLQHLSINNKRGPLSFLSAEDCMVLTASSQLTHLSLTGCQMPADGCSKMFGAEWQLPFLWRLEAAPSILADPAAVALLSLCCPKLQSVVIQLPSAASQRLVGPVNLSGLPQISGLTRLVLLGVTVAGSSGFRALGQLAGLQELVVSALRGFRLADVMQLTSCKELRYLKLLHMQLTNVLAASLCLTHQGREDRPANVWVQLPPALLKQALWLFPFRSLPADEEIQQVTELINAQQMHYLVEPSSPKTLGPMQQQIISLTLALLQLQQQRKALASVLAGELGHPLLQQLQQQTQGMREVLMKQIADMQECIKNPSHMSRLDPSTPQPEAGTAPYGSMLALSQAAVTAATQAPPAAASFSDTMSTVPGAWGAAQMQQLQQLHQHQQQQQQQLLMMQAAGSDFAMQPLLQQQLHLKQALQASELFGSASALGFPPLPQQLHQVGAFNPFMPPVMSQALNAAPMTLAIRGSDPRCNSLSIGGLAGAIDGMTAAAAVTAALSAPMLQLPHQPVTAGFALLRPQSFGNHSSGGSSAPNFLPMQQQQQGKSFGIPATAAAGNSTPAQTQKRQSGSSAVTSSMNSIQGAPPGLGRPPGLYGPPTLTPRSCPNNQNMPAASAAFTTQQLIQCSSGFTQQQQLQLLGGQHFGGTPSQMLMSAGNHQAGSLTAAALLTGQGPTALSFLQQLQEQQLLMSLTNDITTQLMPQQANLQLQELLLLQRFAQQQQQQQQQQHLAQQLAQLQALAGLQDSFGGLALHHM